MPEQDLLSKNHCSHNQDRVLTGFSSGKKKRKRVSVPRIDDSVETNNGCMHINRSLLQLIDTAQPWPLWKSIRDRCKYGGWQGTVLAPSRHRAVLLGLPREGDAAACCPAICTLQTTRRRNDKTAPVYATVVAPSMVVRLRRQPGPV